MRKELSEMSLEELWQLFPIILKEHNRDGYTEAKTGFIKHYTEMARKDFGNRYMTF